MRPLAAALLVAPLAIIKPAYSAGLPEATQAMLQEMKFGPGVLDGLDAELALPGATIEAAKKEGKARVRFPAQPPQFAGMAKIFNARYPGIELEYSQGIGRGRALQPLLAFKTGTIITDVVSGFVPNEHQYREERALLDISDLPGFRNMPKELQAPDGISVSFQLNYWCTAYNTAKVKNKANLPKRWEDLLTNPRWRGGAVGLVNRPHLWLTNLWGVYGDKWADDYMKGVFGEMKGQLRKESGSGMMKLLGIGEFDLMFPAADSLIKREFDKGVPIAYHCPEPVPVTDVNIGIMKGSPNANAARVFVNWALSKEGQLAAYHYAEYSPAHTALAGQRALMAFPDEVIGRKLAFRTQAVTRETPRITQAWNKMWVAGGGGGEERAN
ncbi:MAG TPA: extracellular solute-binding protein [Alphaproteobacteria bacterium]